MVSLYLNSASDYSINDATGKVVTVEEAKRLWEAGLVDDFNMAFHRLAHGGFDVDALKAYYSQGGR